MATISERLADGRLLLLDGGVSTEIQRRGIPLDPNVWSGLTTKTNPDDVREVHEDYILSGSDVITTNTYATARHVLDAINLGHESKILNLMSVQLAKQARDNVAQRDVWIAGSMSSMPPFTCSKESVVNDYARGSYQELAEGLANAGVDLIVCEMMRDIENASIVIEAAVSTGLPVWIGYSAMMDESGVDVKSLRWKSHDCMDTTHDFDSMLQILVPKGGQVSGIMHTQVGDVGHALQVLGHHWSGPKMAYAETGKFESPDWIFDEIVSPQSYLCEIQNWIKDYGVQVVGGCCGTGPEHIRVLHENLR